jgi:hypothetical protein
MDRPPPRPVLVGRVADRTEVDVDRVDIDNLIATLQSRVADRRASGDYPPGLEQELESEFAVIMDAMHRDEVTTIELGRRVSAIEHTVQSVRGSADNTSRVPGGSTMHVAAGRLVSRHTNQLADSVRRLGADIAGALHEILRLFDAQRDADERQLTEVISSVLDRLAVIDHLADSVVDLERRMAAIESAAPPHT